MADTADAHTGAEAMAKPDRVFATCTKTRRGTSPAWQTLDNRNIKGPPLIKGIKVRDADKEPEACEDFASPMTIQKTEKVWKVELRSKSKGLAAKEDDKKPGFWTPGTGRGVHSAKDGGTRGVRGDKEFSVCNAMVQSPPPMNSNTEAQLPELAGEKPPSAIEVHEFFTHVVCAEKQDIDVYPKPRSFSNRRKQERKDTDGSPRGTSNESKSTQSTACSIPLGPAWAKTSPRRGQKPVWDEKEEKEQQRRQKEPKEEQ